MQTKVADHLLRVTTDCASATQGRGYVLLPETVGSNTSGRESNIHMDGIWNSEELLLKIRKRCSNVSSTEVVHKNDS